MTFNVLLGAEGRFDAVLSVVARARPDLLVLQECLGWDAAGDGRMARVAAALGLPEGERHAVLGPARPRGSGRRFHVALFSRVPIASWRAHNDPNVIGHCLVEARLASGLVAFGAHFDAHGESPRFVEARYLRSRLDPAAFARAPHLLAGDLNSLSRRDPYPADLAERVRAAGTDKYGHPPRFEVIDELEAQGWVDALYHRGAPAAWVTARRDRGGVAIDYRTDYVFASPPLAARLVEAAVAPAEGASDHDAVVAAFELP
ncbi:MAG TPA: endonuclease/exonuclease/phosphatase family protein [Polyangiaceae bacterium]|nr:endonuclease/exonuclease/phosphatase family protein [Polyangiaceae bacterium]